MAAGASLSLEEYLHTTYHPDCEYVEGKLVERNVGKREHSLLQAKIARFLDTIGDVKGFWTFTEQRVQVAPQRVRVPDICVVVGKMPEDDVLTFPPFLCIEILSPDDRAIDVRETLDDYFAFGVRWVWVVNPKSHGGEIHTRQGSEPAKDDVLTTRDPEIAISLRDIYRSLERA